MRRTVATMLVVASPVLMAGPVGAQEGRLAGPNPAPAPMVAPAAPVTAAPASPVIQSPVTIAPPATPVAVTPATPVPARAVPAVHPAARAPRARAVHPAGIDDAAYTARLQADLCLARAIFCGLDNGGHYRAH